MSDWRTSSRGMSPGVRNSRATLGMPRAALHSEDSPSFRMGLHQPHKPIVQYSHQHHCRRPPQLSELSLYALFVCTTCNFARSKQVARFCRLHLRQSNDVNTTACYASAAHWHTCRYRSYLEAILLLGPPRWYVRPARPLREELLGTMGPTRLR